MDAGFAPFVPHLSHFQRFHRPRPDDDWLAVDFAWVEVSDALLRLPGDSVGADAEVRLASRLQIPLLHSVEEVVALGAR